MLPQALLGIVLSVIVLTGHTQDFIPVDALLDGFMDNLQYNLTSTLAEPQEEAKKLMLEQRTSVYEILRKLDVIEQELSSLKECCRSGKENFEWSRRLCSKASRTCPPGWQTFNHSCYYISTTTGNWQAGLEYCRSIGSDYVQISSFAEWDFLSGVIEEITWIGLNDINEEGNFRWSIDDSPPLYKRFMSGEPNNYYEEDCVHSDPGYSHEWNDDNCDKHYKFACEVSLESMYG